MNTKKIIVKGKRVTIQRRISDGYVNATLLCKPGGHNDPSTWRRIQRGRQMTVKLSNRIGIPKEHLIKVESITTWVHPVIAVDMARWISAIYGEQVRLYLNPFCDTYSILFGKHPQGRVEAPLPFSLQVIATHKLKSYDYI